MSFVIFTKNKEGVRAIRAIEYEKYVAEKYTRAHVHLWHGSAQIEYSSQKIGTTSMKMVN